MKTYKVKISIIGDDLEEFSREHDMIPSNCSSLVDYFQFLSFVSDEHKSKEK